MHSETTTAILLRKTRLSDTSWIITWCSQTCGKIKTVAKGARRPRSPFAGRLDLFFDSEIQFVRSKKSELHVLKETVLIEPHEGLRKAWLTTQLASYFVELIELATEPEHPAPELYDLLKRAFRHLNGNPATKRVLLHFESELARLLGIRKNGITAAVAIGRACGRLPVARKNSWTPCLDARATDSRSPSWACATAR